MTQCHFATSSTSSVASATDSVRICTPADATAQITALQRLVDNEAASDQFLLKTITDSVTAVIARCQEKIIEKNIARKSRGQKYISNIVHTKGNSVMKQKSKTHRSNSVFPDRGNSSPIGQGIAAGGGGGVVATAKIQTHPGTNKHKSKDSMSFCDDCGRYVTSRCTLAVCHAF
jgi:hypothetical protein